MKAEIHPEYHTDAVITCACGAKHKIGSTKKDIHVEICSACHPFYTGQEKILDAAGRLEKFQAKRQAAASAPKKAPKREAKKEKREKREAKKK